MRTALAALLALLASAAAAQEPRVLSGGADLVVVTVVALDFIDYLTGPQARARLAQAGYTAPE
jgi:hypothetical protein